MINYKSIIERAMLNKKNMYILFIAGILILIILNTVSIDGDSEGKVEDAGACTDAYADEKRLEEILSKIDGAGNTEVMITYDTGMEKVTVQNSKVSKSFSNDTEHSGGELQIQDIEEERQIVMSGSGSSEKPFVLKEINPRVRGVLVIAEGADNPKISYDITNAVAAVLDVPYYRIQVLKKSK